MSADAALMEATWRRVLAGTGLRTAVVIVPVTADDRAVHLLSASERARVAALRVPKRRAEWLAGRAAAKRAALALLEPRPAPDAVECGRSPGGAPQVVVAGAIVRDVSVTIAHAGGIAGAVAALRAPIGFDIEPLAPVDRALALRAFSERERASLAAAPSPLEATRRALCLWTAKEAVLKALRVGLRWPPARVEVELEHGRAHACGALFRIETVMTPRYVAAIALAGA